MTKTTQTITFAVLTRAGRPIAQCMTAARDGAEVECCFNRTIEGDYVSSGTAVVSRRRDLMMRAAERELEWAMACERGTGQIV